MTEERGVWVFSGAGGQFPSGVFSTRELALAWIESRELEGTLTWYPLDEPAYDWARRKGYFRPKSEVQESAAFVQKFSSASQPHEHFARKK